MRECLEAWRERFVTAAVHRPVSPDHSLDQQLCRWLLLSLDRLQGKELVMTQELLHWSPPKIT
jgi:hypothetical protein